MEVCFNEIFYWPQPKVKEYHLMNLKQHVNYSDVDFIKRIKEKVENCDKSK